MSEHPVDRRCPACDCRPHQCKCTYDPYTLEFEKPWPGAFVTEYGALPAAADEDRCAHCDVPGPTDEHALCPGCAEYRCDECELVANELLGYPRRLCGRCYHDWYGDPRGPERKEAGRE